MLTNNLGIQKYLEDFHAGRISEGLKIGCELDEFIRYKKGAFNIILGHDNLGKTYWRMWYLLCIAVKHKKKFCIWTGENQSGQVVRDLIQQYTGRKFKELSIAEVYRYQNEIRQYFDFVDNKYVYTYDDLLKIFESEPYDGCVIDPYTGLKRKFTHEANYEFLNQSREWVNKNQITLDVCTHPVSDAGRGANSYFPKGHTWEYSLKPPKKDDTEGGKPFANRCDDFIVVHRIADRPDMRFYTLVYVEKIKDVETGGNRTMRENPVYHDFNFGLGFKVEGVDPLRDTYTKGNSEYVQKPLSPLSKEELRPTSSNYTDEKDIFGEPIKDLPF
jgi:hypothetical protein